MTDIDVETIELLWKILPVALIVPFITFFLGRLGNHRDRKLKYRTFIETDEILATYKLKDYKKNTEKGTRILIPKEYKSLEKDIKQKIEKETRDALGLSGATKILNKSWNYLKIKPLGESITTSCFIEIEMKCIQDETQKWDLKLSLPILKQNEEIFIPTDRLDKLDIEYYISLIKISYQTQVGDKMLYKSIRNRENGETIIEETHSIKSYFFFNQKIQSKKGSNIEWIFLEKD